MRSVCLAGVAAFGAVAQRSVRSLVRARPGRVLVACDYSQAELRILAHMSGDAALRAAVAGPGDVFRGLAAAWAGLPPEQAASCSDQQRKRAKTVAYGLIYGVGDRSLAQQLGVSVLEAGQLRAGFFRRFPGVQRLLASIVRQGAEHEHVRTLAGRLRWLSDLKGSGGARRSRAERQAVSSVMQGSAADMLKLAISNAHSRLERLRSARSGGSGSGQLSAVSGLPLPGAPVGQLVLQVHDEVLVECAAVDAAEVAGELRAAMQGAVQLSVPLAVTTTTARSWGDMAE